MGTRSLVRRLSTLLVATLWIAQAATAAEVRVMISAGFYGAYAELVPAFEKASGHHLVTARGPSMGDSPEAVPARLARGEVADVVIIDGKSLEGLGQKGMVLPDTKVDFASSQIGMVVRAGAAKPDISNVDAFKSTLLAAKSIAYSDSGSGTYLSTVLFAKLGVWEQISGKSRKIRGPPSGEPVAAVVARGEAEIGFQQVSELIHVPGISFVGAIPAELQPGFTFAGAVSSNATQPEAARALIKFLSSPEAAAAITKAGLAPMTSAARSPERVELSVPGDKRQVPLLVYLPADTKAAPVVLFSHGLGGSREGNAFMGEHWAARGYVAVFLQHPGSDTSVWKDAPPAERMRAMRSAASASNLMLRIQDVHATLDQLERWNKDAGSRLHGRLDLAHIGMSGHSFGAVTTQAVSGQSFPVAERTRDKRIVAAILYSPSGPRAGGVKDAFGGVDIPWLLMTGTHDTAPIGAIDVESRLTVFPALPSGGKYELVLDHAEHSAFTDRALPGDKQARNPNHHRAILAISTAFWDAYLRGDAQAREWLDGPGARSVLETADRWQLK